MENLAFFPRGGRVATVMPASVIHLEYFTHFSPATECTKYITSCDTASCFNHSSPSRCSTLEARGGEVKLQVHSEEEDHCGQCVKVSVGYVSRSVWAVCQGQCRGCVKVIVGNVSKSLWAMCQGQSGPYVKIIVGNVSRSLWAMCQSHCGQCVKVSVGKM